MTRTIRNVPVFKVTPDKTFEIDMWNGDPIPDAMLHAVENAGFQPVAGAGYSFLYKGEDWQEGELKLAEMGFLRLG